MTLSLRFLAPALVVLALLVTGCTDGTDTAADVDTDRATLIAENIKLELEQLRDADVQVTGIEDSEIPGFDKGVMRVGRQEYKFIITEDQQTLLLLAAEPINIGRSPEEIAQVVAEREAEVAQEAKERVAQFAEATEGLPVRGNPSAPITIIEFSDFQCPYCQRAANTVEQVLEKYPDDVKLVYLHFPLGNHPWAKPAAIASYCAAQADADAFWTLHDFYFDNQRALTPANVIDRSRDVLGQTGIDMAAWSNCATDESSAAYQAASAEVDANMALGQEHGVSGTPAFFINGRLLSGAKPIAEFEQMIEQVKASS